MRQLKYCVPLCVSRCVSKCASKKILFLALLFLGGVGYTPVAHAQIVVNAVTRTMLPNRKPIENVEVSNFSEERILQADIFAEESIIKPDGTEDVKLTDDFLIAPASMILRPNENKKARLVLRRPPSENTERYYRVTFKAKVPDALRMDALGLTTEERQQQDALSANISMISGMGIFITVAPANMKPKLTWHRDESGITFVNEGNTSIDMRMRKEYCFDGDKKDCISLPYKRIYPGHSWKFDISGDKPLVYYYKVYDSTEKAIIGAVK